MKTDIRFVILFVLIISSFLLTSAAQELSKTKCDEYSMKNEALPEPNQYRKYLDKFVIAKTFFKEYDAVLISEEYALTSLPASNSLQFIAIIVNNQSIPVARQEQQNGIYLIKLRYSVELYHKIVCLWYREELPDDYDLFTVEHESSLKVPFLRTYSTYTNCSIVPPESQTNHNDFCLTYENGRHSETVFENPSASSLIFLKSFHHNSTAGINKNMYVVAVLQQTDTVYARKLWPNLRWIENIVWKQNYNNQQGNESNFGPNVVADSNKQQILYKTKIFEIILKWKESLN